MWATVYRYVPRNGLCVCVCFFGAVFLVWSLDWVAKLHYLILECENATLLI